ncbi:MAG TPA: phosphotransferase [Bacilli bacterium]|nr:phosphotransferase [Bacilli bacterium]
MLNERLIGKLQDEFGLNFRGFVRLRTVVGVRTDGGAMILKRYVGEGMKRRLEALGDALDVVLQAGVEIAPYLRTRTDDVFVTHRDELWTLQPWLPGRHVSMRTREERRAAAGVLADLHNVPAGRLIEAPFFLRVPPLWEKYRHRLERAQNATLKAFHLRELWRPFADQAALSLHELQRTTATRALERDARYGSLCHRDPAPHNFLWQGERAALIDFDLAGLDARAHDLYQLMNHALYLNGWERRLFSDMIEAYERVRPLGHENRKTLEALMLFPSLVVREWYDYGKTGNRDTFKPRLDWAMKQEELRMREVRALF